MSRCGESGLFKSRHSVKNKKLFHQTVKELFVVGVTGFEPTASWSRTKRATNCATPRKEKPQQLSCCGVVGDERIELPRAESESAALPLCESPSGFVLGVCPQRSYIIACPTGFVNAFFEKTSIFSPKFSVFQNSSLLRQSFSVIRCRWISLTAGGTFIPWANTACPTRCTP